MCIAEIPNGCPGFWSLQHYLCWVAANPSAKGGKLRAAAGGAKKSRCVHSLGRELGMPLPEPAMGVGQRLGSLRTPTVRTANHYRRKMRPETIRVRVVL